MGTYRSTFAKALIGVVVLALGCNLSSGLDGLTNTGSGAVRSLENVEDATVQIEAQGSFVDPQVGLQQNVAGRGSGFIIDEAGVAVTNNHVVTGAAFLQVWVGGESEPRNARVLGVSERSDLAVIDIEGEGYPYLEWFDGPLSTGITVFAAGFPLGDPEFTLTRGIVSKERARGETNWASVDAVIEHDATINPGNSGGPLVAENGKVVGVNFAGSPQARQQFAIARDEALRVIEPLRAGQEVNSIGVNGTAVTDGERVSGIWVASVQSGSPADRAGVKGGDIITRRGVTSSPGSRGWFWAPTVPWPTTVTFCADTTRTIRSASRCCALQLKRSWRDNSTGGNWSSHFRLPKIWEKRSAKVRRQTKKHMPTSSRSPMIQA
jgi:serine protease Do